MQGYESHLIIKGYEQHVSLDSIVTIIPSNTEKFVAFQIGKLRFIDNLQFLNAGLALDKLVNTMTADAFKFTSKFSQSSDLAKQKGIYPYEYMTDPSKFDKLHLPAKEMFYSSLNETEITDDEYKRAQDAWMAFECNTLKDYQEAYLMTDVVLLADVFENFREVCLKNYGLDPAHFYTTISNRYAQANNIYTDDGLNETEPTSYLCYLDANNLYGHTMS